MSGVARAEKRSEWRDRLGRYSQSKLSVTEFCRRERVSAPSFYHWRRKLAEASSSGAGQGASTDANFVPVHLSGATELQISFPNGARLTLAMLDVEVIRMTLEAVAQACTSEGGG